MKSSTLIKGELLLFLVIFLLAPFTFLKPAKKLEIVNEQPVSRKVSIKPAIEKIVEQPLHNVQLPDFSAIKDIKTKKQRFFDFMRPAVIKENAKLLAKRTKLDAWLEKISLGLSLTDDELVVLADLAKKYRVNVNASELQQVNELLVRIDIVPAPLVLVQAANESAWGTSRFSRIGLNFFGIWCYRQGCGMVPGGRNTGAKHEVAAFKSLDDAVARYFHNLNSNNAYRVFRTIRFELRSQQQALNPEILATGLLPYSERGVEYVIDISKMLRHNQQYFTNEVSSSEVGVGD